MGTDVRLLGHPARLLLAPTPSLPFPRLQGVVRPVTAASCVAVAAAPLFNWLLIFKAGEGAARTACVLAGPRSVVSVVSVVGCCASPSPFHVAPPGRCPPSPPSSPSACAPGLGLDGAVLATIATWALMLCMVGGYLIYHEKNRLGTPEQTWHGW